MVVKNNKLKENQFKKIRIECPQCKTVQFINIPYKLINQSGSLTTIGIPSNYICEHSFQVFMDSHFDIRGYQVVDFEITHIEFSSEDSNILFDDQEEEFGIITYDSSIIIKKIIKYIREIFQKKEVLGGALITSDGLLLYSSLSNEIYLKFLGELELNKSYIENIKNIIFILDDNQKILSEFIILENIKLILIIDFSAEISINLGFKYLLELIKSIISIIDVRIEPPKVQYSTGPRWLFSKISNKALNNNKDEIILESLGIKLSKSVILNIEEIKKKSENGFFEGKIYISDRYVKLMEGLALTLKDAAIFMENLNKKP
ncbi:MAG: hypothetical protein ACFFD5_06975 [Candidatus Thorarchaeota archaeon]